MSGIPILRVKYLSYITKRFWHFFFLKNGLDQFYLFLGKVLHTHIMHSLVRKMSNTFNICPLSMIHGLLGTNLKVCFKNMAFLRDLQKHWSILVFFPSFIAQLNNSILQRSNSHNYQYRWYCSIDSWALVTLKFIRTSK